MVVAKKNIKGKIVTLTIDVTQVNVFRENGQIKAFWGSSLSTSLLRMQKLGVKIDTARHKKSCRPLQGLIILIMEH